MGNLPPRRQRPFGITLLSLVLAWLAVAGFGNAVVWNSPPVQAAQRQLGISIGGALFSTAAIAYGIMALMTSVGLWRMAHWAGRVYLGWCCTAVILGAYFLPSDLLLASGFILAMLLVLALGYRYIRRSVTII